MTQKKAILQTLVITIVLIALHRGGMGTVSASVIPVHLATVTATPVVRIDGNEGFFAVPPTATPIPPQIDQILPGDALLSGEEVTLLGFGQPGARIEIYLDSRFIEYAYANQAGNWEVVLANVEEGSHTVSVKQRINGDTIPALRKFVIQVATATPTPMHTLTPTFTPRPMIATPVAPPPTPTPTPPQMTYAAVMLSAPVSGAALTESPVTLTWQPVANLRSGDHYVVVIEHKAGASWLVVETPSTTFNLKDYAQHQFLDGFHWYVGICRGAMPQGYAQNPCSAIGGQSEVRTFKWAEASQTSEPSSNGGDPPKPYPPPVVP